MTKPTKATEPNKPVEQSWQNLAGLLLHKQRHGKFSNVRFYVVTSGGGAQSSFSALLEPEKDEELMTIVNIGHTISLSAVYLDQNGNPMLVAPTPDSAPTWSNTTSATETLKVSADGSSCEADPVAPGTDVVSFSVVVGGKTFSATLAVEVDPEPQVLTSIAIKAVVSA